MASFARVIYPYYCGNNYYAAKYIIVEYDKNELLRAIKKKRTEAKKLLRRLEKLSNDLKILSRLCPTIDCQEYMNSKRFEFETEILEELGVKYEKEVITCPDEPPHFGDDYPSGVLLSLLIP